MNQIVKPTRSLQGEIEVPGDKSITHRAFILGALCQGKVQVNNFSPAADCLSTLNCLKSLGVKAQIDNSTILIQGKGLFGLKKPKETLNAGNSGTTARLLCGILAGQRFDSALDGDASLRRRPMDRIIKPLSGMGAEIKGENEGRFLPLEISGRDLKSMEYELALPSAQVKSALLLAGLLADGETIITGALNSRDHTERMLSHLGAKFEKTEKSLSIEGRNQLSNGEIFVPGDLSSAAFFMVAALLVPNSKLTIKQVGLNPTRTGLLKVLKRMGAEITLFEEKEVCREPIGNIHIKSSQLQATQIVSEEIPLLIDEIPILAVAATQAEGKTVIGGASELRIKESDRLSALATELKKMGADLKELPEGLEITGPTKLRGATVNPWGDHRIAMALAVAGLVASEETIIQESHWVDISFPGFFKLLNQTIIR